MADTFKPFTALTASENKSYFQEKKLVKLKFFFNRFGCIEDECKVDERKKALLNNEVMKSRLGNKMYYFVHNIEPTIDESSWSPISFDMSHAEIIKTGLKNRNL